MADSPNDSRPARPFGFTSTDLLHLVVLGILLGLSPLVLLRTGADWRLPVGYAAMVVFLVMLARVHDRNLHRRSLEVLHLWYPLLYVLLIFWSLVYVVPALRPEGLLDAELIRFDHRLLGFDPAAASVKMESPWLTDLMHVVYASYFVLPVVLVIVLMVHRRRKALEETIFVLCLSFYLCYVGYVLVPATGPRYAIFGHNEMEGLFLTQPIRDVIDSLEPGKADAFPSAHTAVTLVIQYLALRHAPRLGRWLLPLTVAILLSLVYTRYHYVVDILAGVAFAAVTILAGPYLHQRWARRVSAP